MQTQSKHAYKGRKAPRQKSKDELYEELKKNPDPSMTGEDWAKFVAKSLKI